MSAFVGYANTVTKKQHKSTAKTCVIIKILVFLAILILSLATAAMLIRS
jgi:hypothetical protein